MRQADLAIAVSAYTAELVAATGARPRRLRVIANGADVPDDPTPLTAERPTILTIARIEERYKGHDVMVRALALTLAKVPDAQWVVIGDGSLRPSLEALARSYGVERSIRFLGAVDDEQRDAWLRRARAAGDAESPARRRRSPERASGSSIWRPALMASRSSRATSAVRPTPCSTARPACSSTRSTRSRWPARSPRCCSTTASRSDSARAGAGTREGHTWRAVAARVQLELLELIGRAGVDGDGLGVAPAASR